MSNLLFSHNPNETKSVYKALTEHYGLGKKLTNFICGCLGICRNYKVKDLTTDQIEELEKQISTSKIKINQALKKERLKGFEQSVHIKSYKGLRKVKGYPANGQRTRSNAKTARKKRIL